MVVVEVVELEVDGVRVVLQEVGVVWDSQAVEVGAAVA